MSVLEKDRKLSAREASKVLFDLQDMIIQDEEKMPIESLKYVGERTNRVMWEITELMYFYNDTYATKGKEENHLRRNIYIILINQKLVELHKTLLPFIAEIKKMSKYRIARYTDMINEIILLNANNVKRNIKMDDELFDRIKEYNDDVKNLCKEVMQNKEYKFEYCHHYIRSSFEKAEFVKAAKILEKYTLSKIKKCSDVRRIVHGENIHRLSADIFYYCHKANSILPLCQEEYLERISYLYHAKRLLENFDKALSRFLMSYYCDARTTGIWSDKYYQCAKLVDAIIAYDNSHFKKLPPKCEIDNYEELKKQQYSKIKELEETKK